MRKNESEPELETIPPNSCIILGKELNQALKQLKVAFPKKKLDRERTSIQINGLSEGLSFELPGGRVLATAKISNEFKVVIPWILFKHTFVLPWKAAESINIEFSDGCLRVNKVATYSSKIIFQSGKENNPTK